jgi:hypothetical protein
MTDGIVIAKPDLTGNGLRSRCRASGRSNPSPTPYSTPTLDDRGVGGPWTRHDLEETRRLCRIPAALARLRSIGDPRYRERDEA